MNRVNSKRHREEACHICNHYHDYYGGEPCSVCGHVKGSEDVASRCPGTLTTWADPTLVLNDFLYLGGYDAASRCELLRTLGVSHLLNCVPTLDVLYRTSFSYHTVSTNPPPLQECFEFLDRCHRQRQRVLVYCMTGRSRAPTVVVAYLMKLKGWRLLESYRWVRDRRPGVKLGLEEFKMLAAAEEGMFGEASVGSLEELEAGKGAGVMPSQYFFHVSPLVPGRAPGGGGQ